jgi:hypothetical protein
MGSVGKMIVWKDVRPRTASAEATLGFRRAAPTPVALENVEQVEKDDDGDRDTKQPQYDTTH